MTDLLWRSGHEIVQHVDQISSLAPLKVCFGNRNIAGKLVEISLFYYIISLLLHRFAVRISLPFIYFALINDGVAHNCEVRHHSRVCHCRLADIG